MAEPAKKSRMIEFLYVAVPSIFFIKIIGFGYENSTVFPISSSKSFLPTVVPPYKSIDKRNVVRRSSVGIIKRGCLCPSDPPEY